MPPLTPPLADLRAALDRLLGQPASQRKSAAAGIAAAIDELASAQAKLDPIRDPVSVFDPASPKVMGRFAALALVAQTRYPLADIPRTYGSGVYAIYYTGAFATYHRISRTETPIYVGQAAPAIRSARTTKEQGDRLSRRLADHRKSIGKATSSLDLADFEYRSLVVQSGWEHAAEAYLIHLFRPVWNSETNLVYGLGKHGDDAKTRANKRSPWDTLHPGREWATATLADAKTRGQIDSELARHFATHPIYPDLQSILASFIDELRQV